MNKYYLTILMLVSVLFFNNTNLVFSSSNNIIPNSSVESATVSSTSPDSWSQDNWGNNTADFVYENTGYSSGHSVYVKVSGYKSGDSKWYFTPINVNPDSDYVFSDFYKSNVKTSIVAMSLDAQGNPTYFDVSTVVAASSSAWKQATYKFHTLANTKTLTIFHLIQKNGWLQTDGFNLSPEGGSVVTNYVPNNSMEVVSPVDSSLPDKWSQSSWGTNTPVYEYSNDGHNGSRSVKLTMTNYFSGDAKWDYTPQALPRGKDYQFTAWYKTDTIPHVVVHYIKNNGTEDFFGLSDPEPVGTGWQQYKGVFPVPQDVKTVSVFFFLTNNGTVQTDDYQITPYQYVGFNRPIVTLTFDNGFEDNVTTALPTLDKYGFKVTYCYSTEYVEGQPPIQATDVLKIANDGNETCSHSVHHSDMTLESVPNLDYELSHSQSYLEALTGQKVTDFLTPFGAYNSTVINEIKKYYNAHRTTDAGYNSKDNLNPYKLLVQNMDPTTTLAQFQQWVNKAKADKTWLIIVYHQIYTPGVPVGLQSFDTHKVDFDNQMKWLSTAGVTVEPMSQALAEVQTQ
jgi:peptidoglycan/xylan/chitin deacetylase (PgdA/CDA1 family)